MNIDSLMFLLHEKPRTKSIAFRVEDSGWFNVISTEIFNGNTSAVIDFCIKNNKPLAERDTGLTFASEAPPQKSFIDYSYSNFDWGTWHQESWLSIERNDANMFLFMSEYSYLKFKERQLIAEEIEL